MIGYIKDFFVRNQIFNYRIVEHIITEYNLDFTISGGGYERLSKNTQLFIVMFESSGKMRRISLPPCEKETVTAILEQIIDDEVFWINIPVKLTNENKDQNNSNKSLRNSINKYEKELVEALNSYSFAKKIAILESRNKYFNHRFNVFNNNLNYNQIHVEYISSLRTQCDKERDSFINGRGNTVKDLFKNLKCNNEILEEKGFLINESILRGNVVIPYSIMEVFFNILINALSGQFIEVGRSFIKADDFGNQLFSPCLSISDNPYYYSNQDLYFDCEGSLLKNKHLIKQGVLIDCYNDIESAAMLNLVPGNLFYDYERNTTSIQSTTIVIETNRIIEPNDINIYIEGIYNKQINMDFISGDITLSLYGIDGDSKQLYSYLLNINIIELFNKIIGGIGKKKETSKYVMMDTVINFD